MTKLRSAFPAVMATVALSAGAFGAPAAAAPGRELQPPAAAAIQLAAPEVIEGMLPDGSTYRIELPKNWNGTLLLFAHGYNPGPANPAQIGTSAATNSELLDRGYALAGASYPGLGWQTHVAEQTQLELIAEFNSQVGEADRIIAWGTSMGGEITALLAESRPEAIDGAVALCPQTAGVPVWLNSYLDGAYTLHALLDPATSVEFVDVTDPDSTLAYWVNLATEAQESDEGRARIALAAAFAGIPAWTQGGTAEPARHDYAAQQGQQYAAISSFAFFHVMVRASMESAAGGPFSWNTGADYTELYRSLDQQARQRVEVLYRDAGLNLHADLATLNAGERIEPSDPAAIERINDFTHRGTPGVPLLAMQTTGDPMVFPNLMRPYSERVNKSGHRSDVREVWVHSPGHCTFTPSEQIAAIETMDTRLDTGRWPATSAPVLNRLAGGDSRFVNYKPAMPVRPELMPD